MANFPPDIVALRAEHQERLQQFVAAQTPGAPAVEDEASKEKENDETTPPSNSKYFVHKVRKTDTLQGLALHYQVASVDLIRQVNPATIIGDIFQHNEFILIPRKVLIYFFVLLHFKCVKICRKAFAQSLTSRSRTQICKRL